jgi:hypothetical protein
MASMKEIQEQQKVQRMDAFHNLVDAEMAAMFARLEAAVISLNVPFEDGADAIPWLILCHMAQLDFEGGISKEDFSDEAKRAYEQVEEDAASENDSDELPGDSILRQVIALKADEKTAAEDEKPAP